MMITNTIVIILALIGLILMTISLYFSIKNIKDELYYDETDSGRRELNQAIEVKRMGFFGKNKKEKEEENAWRAKLDEEAKTEAMKAAESEYKTKKIQEEKERLLGGSKSSFIDKLSKGFGGSEEKVGKALGGGQTLKELASDEKIDRMLGRTSGGSSGRTQMIYDKASKQQPRPFSNMPNFTDEINIKSVPNINVDKHMKDDVEVYEPKKPNLNYRKVDVRPESVNEVSRRMKRFK